MPFFVLCYSSKKRPYTFLYPATMSVRMQKLKFGFRLIKKASHSNDKQHDKMGLSIIFDINK